MKHIKLTIASIALIVLMLACDEQTYQQDRTLSIDYDRTTWIVVIDGDTTFSNAQIYTRDLSDGPHDLTLIKTEPRGWVKLTVVPDMLEMYAINDSDTITGQIK